MISVIFILFSIILVGTCSHDHHHKVYKHPCPSNTDEELEMAKIHDGEKVYKIPCSEHHHHKHHHHHTHEGKEVQSPHIRFGRSVQESEVVNKHFSPKFQVLKKLLI